MSQVRASDPQQPVGTALPERQEFVIRGAHVVTLDNTIGDFSCADIHVRDGEILAVGPDLSTSRATEIDGTGMIAMPGFVDTHWHLWNSSLRAIVRGDDPVHGYFPVTLGIGPLFTPEDSYHSVRLGLAEGLTSGITTVHNWSHNVLTPAHADAELRAMRDMGVRGRFSYGWGQDLPLEESMNLADFARMQREWPRHDSLLELGAALRAPIANPRGSVPLEVLAHECACLRQLGVPITMHARPGLVSVLDAHGLLGADLQLVHPQGVSVEERARVAACRTTFSCSPVIEMLYAQATRGEIQFQELEEAGVQQSLSVDSSSASANADFFACMRALLLSHKQRFGAKVPFPARRLLELATIDGARDLGIADQVGSLTPGKRADILLVRAGDLNMAPMIDPIFSLAYSAQTRNVDTVIVDGRVLVRAGGLTHVDPTQIAHNAAASVQGLVARSGATPAVPA